jgi:hypothetical protein
VVAGQRPVPPRRRLLPRRPDPPETLPPTLRRAVRAEWARALRPPYETPSVVLANGVLMSLLWTLLPASVVKLVFSFHGPLAFALVLASWMYSDVPATNLLGGDARRGIAALGDRAALRRLWYAKNLVLWLLVTPACAAVAVGIGIAEGRLATTALSVLWIATVPLGALGFAAWLGVRYPYHPLPLRRRWALRHRWRPVLLRWAVLVVTPYGLVPALTVVLTLPSILLWWAVAPQGGQSRITDPQFAAGLLVAAATAAIAWPLGHRYGTRFANRRRDRLDAYLSDPDRG